MIYTTGKKLTPENDLRTELRAHMLAGGMPKEFSIDRNLAPASASKMLANMGIRKVFITDEEHAMILAKRKAAK
jgi:hypothetical protein